MKTLTVWVHMQQYRYINKWLHSKSNQKPENEEEDLDRNMQEQLSRQKELKYYLSRDNFPRQYLQEGQADATLIP